ncbi:hypothetical protein WN943_028950 [Citrus x changshan-huyou]
MLQRSIVIRLLDDFAGRKSTKDLGCYLAVPTLESIGEGNVRENTGEMLFPVVFIGKIFQGTDLEGDCTQDAEEWGSFQLCVNRYVLLARKCLITVMCKLRIRSS